MFFASDILTTDQITLLLMAFDGSQEEVAETALTVALIPLECRKCHAWVPLGWTLVNPPNVSCPQATYGGHSAYKETIDNIRDGIVNSTLAASGA